MQARRFAGSFIEAVTQPDTRGASAMIDWDILLERAIYDAGGSKTFRNGFLKGAKESAANASIVQQIAKNALFRLLMNDGSVSYNEMLLTKDKSGTVRAADVYAYATGEFISQAMRRMYLIAVAGEPSLMEKRAVQVRGRGAAQDLPARQRSRSDVDRRFLHDQPVR